MVGSVIFTWPCENEADQLESLKERLLEQDTNPCFANNDDVETGMMMVIMMKKLRFLLKVTALTYRDAWEGGRGSKRLLCLLAGGAGGARLPSIGER